MSDLHATSDPLRAMSAFVLAGGKSGRFGRDKAFLTIDGARFIDLVIDTCAAIFDTVYLVGKRYDSPRLTGCVTDEITGVGPIGGLYTALRASPGGFIFAVAVDYPLLDAGVIRELGRETVKRERTCDAIVPVMPDGAHPLFAYYHSRCLSAAARCINEGRYRLRCLARLSRVHYLDVPVHDSEPDYERSARYLANFTNINTPAEYDRLIANRSRKSS